MVRILNISIWITLSKKEVISRDDIGLHRLPISAYKMTHFISWQTNCAQVGVSVIYGLRWNIYIKICLDFIFDQFELLKLYFIGFRFIFIQKTKEHKSLACKYIGKTFSNDDITKTTKIYWEYGNWDSSLIKLTIHYLNK